MKWLLIGGIILVVLAVAVLGYLGIIPGIADLFGWNNPKDLGITVTTADYDSANAKLGRERLTLPADWTGDDIVFEGSHPVNTSFSQEEMTATWQTRDFPGNPFTDEGQIKINDDGTVEMSGAVKISDLIALIDEKADIDEDAMNIINKVGFIKGDVPFYMKGTVSVTGGQWNIDIDEAKLGFVSLPADQIPAGAIEDAAKSVINFMPGLSIDSLTFANGMMNFVGTYPDKTYYAVSE